MSVHFSTSFEGKVISRIASTLEASNSILENFVWFKFVAQSLLDEVDADGLLAVTKQKNLYLISCFFFLILVCHPSVPFHKCLCGYFIFVNFNIQRQYLQHENPVFLDGWRSTMFNFSVSKVISIVCDKSHTYIWP